MSNGNEGVLIIVSCDADRALAMEGQAVKMSEIEDRFKIHDLFARYMRSIDDFDEAGLFSCFTDEGVLETPVLGGTFARREGQRQFLRNARKAAEGRQMRHLFTNLEVEIGRNTARARAYLVVNSTQGGSSTIFHTGHYECRLKKVAGNWLFEHRKVFIDGKPY